MRDVSVGGVVITAMEAHDPCGYDTIKMNRCPKGIRKRRRTGQGFKRKFFG